MMFLFLFSLLLSSLSCVCMCLCAGRAVGFDDGQPYLEVEGVTNLDLVPETGCLLSIGFAKTLGGSGGYARYVAVCPSSWASGVSIDQEPGAPLPKQSAPLRRDADGVLRPKAGAAATAYCSGSGSGAFGCADEKPVW